MKPSLALLLAALTLTLLAACSRGGTPNPAPELDGTSWVLTALNGQPVMENSQASLSFTDGQASGNGSCNSFGGEYTRDGSGLTFGALTTTLMACADPGVMDQETAYYAALSATTSFQLDGGMLTLFDADGNALAEFTSAP